MLLDDSPERLLARAPGRRRAARFGPCLASLWLVACTAVTPSAPLGLPSPGSERGLAVFSLTHTLLAATVSYRGMGNDAKGTIDSPGKIPDWSDPPGKLVVVELPVGRYEIYQWEWHKGAAQPMDDLMHVSRDFSVPFEVVDGRATYVGNVFIEAHFAGKVDYVRVLDASDRDLELLHVRYPKIGAADIRKDVSPQVIEQWRE